MKLLLDTHLLLWAAGAPERLSNRARDLMVNPAHDLVFSVASLWEVAIKRALGREDFSVDARVLRRGLLDNGYDELPVLGPHALAVERLPALHKDPFDRILLAQAQAEAMTLLTADEAMARYGSPALRV
jgi:PIN domain nuclease of toxin-antitoxin system